MEEEIIHDSRGLSIPRIEDPEMVCFITLKTIKALLWFVNNKRLHERIAAFLARYAEMYSAIPYGFIIMGNHLHLLIKFPQGNRAAFMNAFASMVAKLTDTYVPEFLYGKLWARRYVVQFVPTPKDIEDYFFYIALNPVSSGLCRDPGDYTTYNSFRSAASGRTEEYKVVEWAKYNSKKRHNKNLNIEDFTHVHKLTYHRLPGHEGKSDEEYERYLCEQWEVHRQKFIERLGKNHKFMTKSALLRTRPGSTPANAKVSTRESKMPLVLCACKETKKECLDKIFSIAEAYRDASRRYRKGDQTTAFPRGTYRPRTAVAP